MDDDECFYCGDGQSHWCGMCNHEVCTWCCDCKWDNEESDDILADDWIVREE